MVNARPLPALLGGEIERVEARYPFHDGGGWYRDVVEVEFNPEFRTVGDEQVEAVVLVALPSESVEIQVGPTKDPVGATFHRALPKRGEHVGHQAVNVVGRSLLERSIEVTDMRSDVPLCGRACLGHPRE